MRYGRCAVVVHPLGPSRDTAQECFPLAALALERPWLPPGVGPRAANQNANDCRWQSYLDILAVERSETDEDWRNVTIMISFRKKGTILKAVPPYLSAFHMVRCRRSSSAPYGGTFPPGEGITQLYSPLTAVGDGRRTARWYAAIPCTPGEIRETGRRRRRPLRRYTVFC